MFLDVMLARWMVEVKLLYLSGCEQLQILAGGS